MRFPWIENYAGTWHDDEGRTLVIKTRDDEHATVDLLADAKPMTRHWCGNAPDLGLEARYSPIDGPDLDIALGRPGFFLNLNYEFARPPYRPDWKTRLFPLCPEDGIGPLRIADGGRCVLAVCKPDR